MSLALDAAHCVRVYVSALAVPAPAQVAAVISGKVRDASSAAGRQATVTVESLVRISAYSALGSAERWASP